MSTSPSTMLDKWNHAGGPSGRVSTPVPLRLFHRYTVACSTGLLPSTPY
ncbi:hypothetical protein [Nocardia brasiliensis]